MFALRDNPGNLNRCVELCKRIVQVQPENYEAWWRLAKYQFYLSDTQKSDAWGEVQTCLKQFETGDGFKTELDFIVASGANPR